MNNLDNNLTPGDPLPTSVRVWNPILQAARNAAQGDAGPPSPTAGAGVEIEVRIKNTESTTCQRFAPIGIDDDTVYIMPPKAGWIETPVLKGIFPAEGGQIAIALEPIPPNKIGRAKLMGLVPASIVVGSAADTKAKAKVGQFTFESADEGYPILWKQSGTGTKFGYILIGSGGAGSKIALVQAPVGGIPARVNKTPGYAACAAIISATASGAGGVFSVGDYVLNGKSYQIENWAFDVIGNEGDRMVQVSGHFDGALVVGALCNNSGSSFFYTQQNPSNPNLGGGG